MRKKKQIFIIVFIAIIFSMVVIVLLSNPLRSPEERIRTDLLEVMPIGTSMEDVISIVESHKRWNISARILYDIGITMGPRGPSRGIPLSDEEVIGEKSIRIHLGQYLAPIFIQTDVTAFVAFDENAELIEIAVRKSMNVL